MNKFSFKFIEVVEYQFYFFYYRESYQENNRIYILYFEKYSLFKRNVKLEKQNYMCSKYPL